MTEPAVMELEQELAAHETCMVKLLSKEGSSQHSGRARLLAIHGDTAVVHPFGHRRTEEVPVSHVKLWKGGNHYRTNERKLPSLNDPYVIYLPQKKLFWAGTSWKKSIDNAKSYEFEHRARQGISKALNQESNKKPVGDDTITIVKRSKVPAWVAPVKRVEPTIPVDEKKNPVWNEPENVIPVLDEAPAAAAPAQITMPVQATRLPTPAWINDKPRTVATASDIKFQVKSSFERWADAMREVAAAEALKLTAQAALVTAQAELEIEARMK